MLETEEGHALDLNDPNYDSTEVIYSVLFLLAFVLDFILNDDAYKTLKYENGYRNATIQM